jgi:hypothetical protein
MLNAKTTSQTKTCSDSLALSFYLLWRTGVRVLSIHVQAWTLSKLSFLVNHHCKVRESLLSHVSFSTSISVFPRIPQGGKKVLPLGGSSKQSLERIRFPPSPPWKLLHTQYQNLSISAERKIKTHESLTTTFGLFVFFHDCINITRHHWHHTCPETNIEVDM